MRAVVVVFAALSVGCAGGSTAPELRDDGGPDPGWRAFTVDEMRRQRSAQGTSFVEVMADSSFRMGLLHGEAGATIGLIEHAENAAYHVVAGSALLSTSEDDYRVGPGSAAFVRGGTEHRFRSITAELDAVVVFARGVPAPGDPEIATFTLASMVAARDPERNVWTPLLDSSSMSLGMYMLPKGGRDAGDLAHDFDELKLVVRGGGRFDLGTGGVEVAPGSVTFIESDLRHRFRRISDELDVLVVLAR